MQVTSRQIVESTVAALPVLPVETFYNRNENPVTDRAIAAAEAMMAIDSPKEAAAHQALSALDDYNGASGAFAEALFLLGVEYGIKIATGRSAGKEPNVTDAKLLEAARRAQSEGGSFTEIYQTSASVTGLLELLAKLTSNSTVAGTNWGAVANLIEENARRNQSVESALFSLMDVESEARDAS